MRTSLGWFVAAVLAFSWTQSVQSADESSQREFFERRIRPVLVERCFKCHSSQAEEVGGGLPLDTRLATRRGGESGEAVVPGDTEASLLLSAIEYRDFQMPPDNRFPEDVVADFRRWIESGAFDPREVLEHWNFELRIRLGFRISCFQLSSTKALEGDRTFEKA